MAATRAQKIRLSIFLLTTAFIVVGVLMYLVGASLMQVRDVYRVVLQGGSGGLEVGSQVRYNDIIVGRVESVGLDPEDPSQVFVWVSLEHGTPVTEDTVAVPEMASITGSKMLSMRGGTKTSKRLKPGDTIEAASSDLSMLTTKIVNISNKLEDLLDNLVAVTNRENMERVGDVLNEVTGITSNVNALIATNMDNINGIVLDVRQMVTKVDGSIERVDRLLDSAERAVNGVASPHNVKQFTTILGAVNALANNAVARTSDAELGQTIQSVNRLVSDSSVTVLRLRTDLQRVMRELETSVENINEFTQILIENPSVLISGRSEKERQLK